MMVCEICDRRMAELDNDKGWCSHCGTVQLLPGVQQAPMLAYSAIAVLRQIADGPEDSGTHAVESLREACLSPSERG